MESRRWPIPPWRAEPRPMTTHVSAWFCTGRKSSKLNTTEVSWMESRRWPIPPWRAATDDHARECVVLYGTKVVQTQHHRGKLDGKPPLADPAPESGAATDDHARECVVLYGTKVLQTRASARSYRGSHNRAGGRTDVRGWRFPVRTTVSRPVVSCAVVFGKKCQKTEGTCKLSRLNA